ncbi:MAG: hypothetical protein QM714_06915 [Nocardioides sp.]|uniref:hypothetical protein n=1 Tax=Nocardioides sp. TaxID=35761 RepID=UPI0039E29EE6
MQKHADAWYRLCTTRTTQESKLFPVSAYMMYGYALSFLRYPTLLRRLSEHMSPEEVGDRIREVHTKSSVLNLSVAAGFFLGGRELFIDMGLIKPTDAVEDVYFVEDFFERLHLSFHRQHSHALPSDANMRAQMLPERRLQVYEADAIPMRPGDRLHTALKKFMATASQFAFLSHCESRPGIFNDGPYRTRPNEEMLVRGFADLGEGDLPWLDGVTSDVIHNNLTIPVIVKDTHFHIVDDWSSFEATPSYDHDKVIAAGLYTSDFLSDGHIPVAMDNAATMADFLEQQTDVLQKATRDLWQVMSGWTREQMLDAGALTYAACLKDIFHLAGIYDQDDWFTMDPRLEEFRPIFNDEYGNGVIGEMLGTLSLTTQQRSPYVMSKWNDMPASMWTPIPYSVLTTDDYTLRLPEMPPGLTTSLPPKTEKYLTTRGKLSQDEYNAAAKGFTPGFATEPYRFLDDGWVQHNYTSDLARDLYEYEQRTSKNLRGRGAGLTRADLDQIRAEHETVTT